MVKYPIIPAEDVLFRELFIDATYVVDNGGTITGTPIFNQGGTFDGTNESIDYGNILNFERTQPCSFEAMIKQSGTGGIQSIISKQLTTPTYAGWHFFMNNGKISLSFANNVGTGDYLSGYYNTLLTVDTVYHVLATYDGSSAIGGMNFYINGAPVATQEGANGLTASIITAETVKISERGAGDGDFEGEIKFVNVFDRELTAAEAFDRFTQFTFKEPTPENAEIWLPLRTHYHDGSNEVTPNLGNLSSDQVRWGDGTVGVTNPTLLENNGISMDGGDYIELVTAIDFAAGFSFFCLFNVTALPTDKTLLAGTFDANSMVDIQVDSTGFIQSAFYNGTDLFGASSTVFGPGWHSIGFVKTAASTSPILYLDGILQTGTTVAAINGAVGLYLGQRTDGSDNFVGSMKFPIITTTELTHTQAKWLHDKAFRELNL